eukprot:6211032-Pleurochrysis_carterae.AAC.1
MREKFRRAPAPAPVVAPRRPRTIGGRAHAARPAKCAPNAVTARSDTPACLPLHFPQLPRLLRAHPHRVWDTASRLLGKKDSDELAQRGRHSMLEVHLVPHSHTDPGWLYTFDEYYVRKVKHILNEVLEKAVDRLHSFHQ